MKIILFILLIPILVFSQESKTEYLNFKLTQDKDIIWQKVYNDEISTDKIKSYLAGNDFTSKLELKDSMFVGRSGFTKLSSLKGAPIAAYQSYNAFIKIEIKKNRYRITVSKVKFNPTEISVISGGIGIGQAIDYSLEELVVRNKHYEIRKNKNIRRMLTTMNNDLDKYFIFQKKKQKDDW